jgi:glutathione S-transferase
MLLIGQFDSPFVRRVAIAMTRYGMPFEHRTWSVWSDAAEIARYNPLRKVPTLVLDDGDVLLESSAILDWLDEQAGPARAMLPARGPARRDGLRIAGLACGLAEKAVSLVYERVVRAPAERSAAWVARCEAQIGDTLRVLDADRARRPGPWWLGDSLTHADVAVACALRFTGEAHPALYAPAAHPALAAHATRAEALPEFRRIVQPLSLPKT